VACTSPIRARRDADGGLKLLKGVSDARLFGGGNKPELELACGHCLDCKIRRSQDWATRCTHEAEQYDDNSFLTLTFSEEGLELRELQHGTHRHDLAVEDWQLFAKRLRKELKKQNGPKLRFFEVGEYGDDQLRPHYHALIFGNGFRGEGETWIDEKGHPAWLSRTVEKCWPYGFHVVKDLTPETVNYVCRYVQKKLWGPMQQKALERTDLDSGETVTVRPEFATMSRRPGIGAAWWKKYGKEVFPDDFVVLKGKKTPVPRYYSSLLKNEKPDLHEIISQQREEKAKARAHDNTPTRRAVRAKVTRGKQGIKRRREL